jgi:hypothetical protein
MRERNAEVARDAVVRDIREAFDGLVRAGIFASEQMRDAAERRPQEPGVRKRVG